MWIAKKKLKKNFLICNLIALDFFISLSPPVAYPQSPVISGVITMKNTTSREDFMPYYHNTTRQEARFHANVLSKSMRTKAFILIRNMIHKQNSFWTMF